MLLAAFPSWSSESSIPEISSLLLTAHALTTPAIEQSDPAGGEGEIRGLMWRDSNGDGIQDVGEVSLEDWVVYLDLDGDGAFDQSDEPFAVTGADGQYIFSEVAPGDYIVAAQQRSGWQQTYPPLGEDGGETPPAPSLPLEDTFLLHSRPGASKVIYLDFDGHTTSGTLWNSLYIIGKGDFTTPAYSFQGDSSFSDAEKERIHHIWERVVEDYLPFDVDVTTEAPPADALIDNGGADENWGVRVVIGGSSGDWYGSSAGGLGYVNSFDWSSDTPVFVFENNLSNGNEKYTAEAISHEVGHSLGVQHDGTAVAEYYNGHGSGPLGWAPIMGIGYYKELTQWSKGEYAGANRQENDLTIITTTNGFSYRDDDHADSIAGATTLDGEGAEGIIERNTDVDYFTFTTSGGEIELAISPASRSPNLDILATLYDQAGAPLATSNPTDSLNAQIEFTLSAGTYFVSIEGTGRGTPETGYSDYGSLGYYEIATSLAVDALPGTYLVQVGADETVDAIDFGNLEIVDFGDVGGAYPTVFADNGARHTVGPDGPFMGLSVNSEGEALATALADGDDDDGVAFASALRQGSSARVSIDMIASPAGGKLSAWIDFNGDGDWSDPGEEILTDVSVTAGTRVYLVFEVPTGAATGITFARFRLSTHGYLNFDGPAGDGEVEDYLVVIQTGPIAGDADTNTLVDAVDLARLGLNWSPGGTDALWSDGDFDGDGDIDATDLAILGMNWSPVY